MSVRTCNLRLQQGHTLKRQSLSALPRNPFAEPVGQAGITLLSIFPMAYPCSEG